MHELTPRQIVAELDKYIVGQLNAKKSVAVALRNRYRRKCLGAAIQDEIMPKNIIMIGPTGVGKTEIARRLAKLVNAPFIKVEATKYTEVGYVGRDVEGIIRDLTETAVRMVKAEQMEKVRPQGEAAAQDRLVELLAPTKRERKMKNPMEMFFGGGGDDTPTEEDRQYLEDNKKRREQVRRMLEMGEMEDHLVEIEVEEQPMMPAGGMDEIGLNIQDMLGNMMPKKTHKRKLSVREARKILVQEESAKLVDMDDVTTRAIERAEQSGIVFIDEIDKIAGRSNNSAAVSRDGVQRDILPIVEGSTVMTKYGQVKTDYILFIAAGAFSMSKPSDLIPELQGRFPIRVELESLTEEDFKRILLEPQNSLVKQYMALLQADGVEVTFAEDGVDALARISYQVNASTENIGARRLHTVLEKVLEDLLFIAPDASLEKVVIDRAYVENKLGALADNEDLSRYIL
ncbi:MAG: ATP-dependent protease ATPase subunit HslU [Firmicutes bacterium]|nr:ATP-dependent protease ATPase subunit HslU [Bacillota bacterium]